MAIRVPLVIRIPDFIVIAYFKLMRRLNLINDDKIPEMYREQVVPPAESPPKKDSSGKGSV